MSDIRVPHFSLPFRIVGTAAAVNEQDSRLEIRDCVAAVVRTRQGTRIELPAFGVPDETFTEGGADAPAILAAVERWEPRAAAAAAADNSSLAHYVSQIDVDIHGGDR